MLGILPLSSLSCSLTAARAAQGRDLDAATRVRLILLAEFKSAQPGLDKTYPQVMVAKEPGHQGEREGNR